MKNNEIKIKHGASSLSEFIERPLPTDAEAEAFEEYVRDEAKEEEIKDSLAKIYQDDQGNRVDVKRLVIKKKRGFFFNLFNFLIVVFVLAGAVYASYRYIYLKWGGGQAPVSLAITASQEVAAGQEFFYTINYKNEDRIDLSNIEIKAKYPDNFIYLDAEPKPVRGTDVWEISGLNSHRSDSIKIKGKLIAPLDSVNFISADMTYQPENFSSEFKKSVSSETKINDLGLDFSFLNSASVLINQENEIIFKFKAKEQNYLNNFRLTINHPDGAEITAPAAANQTAASSTPSLQSAGSGAWQIGNLGKNENELKIKFKVKEKKQPQINFNLKIEFPYSVGNQPPRYYLFYEKNLIYEIIKGDLNINLIINGSLLDQGVDFGRTLNYLISYKNTGVSEMKDVIIMAVLDSDFLDWQTLSDKNNGQTSGNTISWSKSEIPALAALPGGAQGSIDFSLKVKPLAAVDLSKAYQVKSYVNYSVDGKASGGDSQSNTITNKINSDLNLSEQVRYFNDDNIAVGSGPLPPKAGQTTSLKVYWTINNSLHDLNNLQTSVSLPAGVSWDGKNSASTGSVYYDSQNNKVVWQINQLPATVSRASAEFNVKITPTEADRGRIMVILPGTAISAIDSATGMSITKSVKAETTKLEDDNLANTDGVVQ